MSFLNNSLFVLVALTVTILLITQHSLALSYQKVNIGDNKIQIQNNLGAPVLDIQLIENTDQCIVNCHATLKIHPYQTYNIPDYSSPSEKWDFVKADSNVMGLKSYTLQLLKNITYNITVPTISNTSYSCFNNITQQNETCQILEQIGVQTETRTREEWVPFNWFGETLEQGRDYYIKLSAQKSPSLGENNIDWVPTIKGVTLDDWAWWNSSWFNRRNITISENNISTRTAEPVTLNVTGLTINTTCENEIRITNETDDEIPVQIVNSTGESEPAGRQWCEIIFEATVDKNKSVDYFVYYNNPSAALSTLTYISFNFTENRFTGRDYEVILSKPTNSLQVLRDKNNINWSSNNNTIYLVGESTVQYAAGDSITDGNATWTDCGNVRCMINWTKLSTEGEYTLYSQKIVTNITSNITFMYGPYTSSTSSHPLGNDDYVCSSVIDCVQYVGSPPRHTYVSDWKSWFWKDNTDIKYVVACDTGPHLTRISSNPAEFTVIRGGWTTDYHLSPGSYRMIHEFINGTPQNAEDKIGELEAMFANPLSVQLGPEQTGNGTLFITDLIPIQVVEDVDMVKGKTTMIRSTISFYHPNPNLTANITVKTHWNGSLVNTTNITLTDGQSKNINHWYTPGQSGTDIEVKSTAETTISYTFINDTRTTSVDVVETRKFTVDFIPVDDPEYFDFTVDESILFMNKTYPLADDAIKNLTVKSNPVNTSDMDKTDPLLFKTELLLKVRMNSLLTGNYTERTVGILPQSWFSDNLDDTKTLGYAIIQNFPPIFGYPPFKITFNSVVIEDALRSGAAHELGHTFGLCDEYNSSLWEEQDSLFGLFNNYCPNGDVDDDNSLDDRCLAVIPGCNDTTLGELIPWNSNTDTISVYNFMGSLNFQESRWITKESYNHLLSYFSHSTPETASSRLLVSGFYNKIDGSVDFRNFYQLGEGLIENESEFATGNFSIESLDANATALFNISFNLSFILSSANGTVENINVTPFAFVVPFSDNVSSLTFKENATIKEERDRTQNTPNVTLIEPTGGEFYSNVEINISWTSSDADGDNMSYAILFSPDNGTSWDTITFDHNETNYTINSGDLQDCTECLIKILATDGMNTGNDTSDSVFQIDNDLSITEFSLVYSNNTERVFRISVNNTLDLDITNISWILDTGDEAINSQYLTNLEVGEDIFIFVHYNYTVIGNYTVIFTAYTNEHIEKEEIEVII
ncbi:MAG: hypothetical protein ABIJ92_02925 [Candidatus Aenigmatarchaeota archaeon]